MVLELWEASGESDPIDGWELSRFEFDRSSLGRWITRVVVGLTALAVIGAGAWYATGWQNTRSQSQVQATFAAAADVSRATERLSGAIEDLADGQLSDSELATTALADLDGSARRLFESASALDPAGTESGPLRRAALEASQQALELESTLGDAFAYGKGIELILPPPLLPTELEPEAVPEYAATAASWVSRFVEGAHSLPTHPMLETHRDDMTELAAGLEDWQAGYLDALRSGDTGQARQHAEALRSHLSELEQEWSVAAAEIANWGAAAIDVLDSRLEELSRLG